MRKEHKKIRIALTALLLSALMLPTMYFAFGQSDNFFFIDEEEGMRGTTEINAGVGSGSGTWGSGAQIIDFGTAEVSPLGDGILVLAASAGLYMLARARKTAGSKRNKEK